MSLELLVTATAEADLDQAFRWYEDQRLGLGREFLAVVDEHLDRLVGNPRHYPEIHRGLRRALIRRFPYAIFFLMNAKFVVILAVRHQAREPFRWPKRRL